MQSQAYSESLRNDIAECLLLDTLRLGCLLYFEPMLVGTGTKDNSSIWMSKVRISSDYIAEDERV